MNGGEEFEAFLKACVPGAELEDCRGKLSDYENLLREWNQKFNLISEADLGRLESRHFMDSLMPLRLFPDLEWTAALDAGSGAGFPGMALCIARPDLSCAFVESNGKKCSFLERAIAALSLKNCSVLCERAEVLARLPGHREKYPLALTRALAGPPAALELVLPFLKPGGRAVFWTSGEAWKDEKRTGHWARLLGGGKPREAAYALPSDEKPMGRKLVLVEKTGETDRKYPRKAGIPQKRPLN